MENHSRLARLLDLLPELVGAVLAVSLAGGYIAGVVAVGLSAGPLWALAALVPAVFGAVIYLNS